MYADSATVRCQLLLGSNDSFGELLLVHDGSVAIAGTTHRSNESFRYSIGDWVYWSTPREGKIHAAPHELNFQYVFTHSASGWSQEVRRCPWDKVSCFRLDLPHAHAVTMHDDGSFSIKGKHHVARAMVRFGEPKQARIRKREGIGHPIFILAADDEYLALEYSANKWFALSPRLPLQQPSPWQRLPSPSWEPEYVVTIPGLDLLENGSFRVEGREPDWTEGVSFFRRTQSFTFTCMKPGTPLVVERIHLSAEWQFQYLDGKWCTRVSWMPITEDQVIAGLVRLGPGIFQIPRCLMTLWECAAIERTTYDDCEIWKTEGERELLWLQTPERLFAFVSVKSTWYLLCPSTEAFELPTLLVSELRSPPAVPNALNPWLVIRDHLGWQPPLEWRQVSNWLRRIIARLERLTSERWVWVPHDDARFGFVRKGVKSALEPYDVTGLGLYHGGAVLVGSTIFGKRERIDCRYGIKHVRRDPLAADEVQIDEYVLTRKSWKSIRYRYRGGIWWRRVRRDRRDSVAFLMRGMCQVALRAISRLLTHGIPTALQFVIELNLFSHRR